MRLVGRVGAAPGARLPAPASAPVPAHPTPRGCGSAPAAFGRGRTPARRGARAASRPGVTAGPLPSWGPAASRSLDGLPSQPGGDLSAWAAGTASARRADMAEERDHEREDEAWHGQGGNRVDADRQPQGGPPARGRSWRGVGGLPGSRRAGLRRPRAVWRARRRAARRPCSSAVLASATRAIVAPVSTAFHAGLLKGELADGERALPEQQRQVAARPSSASTGCAASRSRPPRRPGRPRRRADRPILTAKERSPARRAGTAVVDRPTNPAGALISTISPKPRRQELARVRPRGRPGPVLAGRRHGAIGHRYRSWRAGPPAARRVLRGQHRLFVARRRARQTAEVPATGAVAGGPWASAPVRPRASAGETPGGW